MKLLRTSVLVAITSLMVGCASSSYKKPKIRAPYGYIEVEKYQEMMADIYLNDDYFKAVWGTVVDEDGKPITNARVGVFLDGRWHEHKNVYDENEHDGKWAGRFFVRIPQNRRAFVGAWIMGTREKDLELIFEGGTGRWVSVGEHNSHRPDYISRIDDIELTIKRRGPVLLKGKAHLPSGVPLKYTNSDDYRDVSIDLMPAETPLGLVVKNDRVEVTENFLMDNIQPGKYVIDAMSGCHQSKTTIDLKPGETFLDIYLKTDAKCVEQSEKDAKDFEKRHKKFNKEWAKKQKKLEKKQAKSNKH